MHSKLNKPTSLRTAPLIVALLLLTCGCGDKSIKTLIVEATSSVDSMSVTVDLIGVNKLDLSRYEGYSINQYWRQDDPLRKSSLEHRETLMFGGSQESTREFDLSEDEWKEWYKSGVRYVVVIADIPGITEDTPGNNARRQTIPLSAKELKESLGKKTKTVKLVVRDVGLLVQSE